MSAGIVSAVEPDIRFCRTELGRIAFATLGNGPALVAAPGWISHLEVAMEYEPIRRFVTALAQRHRFVIYDALGTGLSEHRREERLFTLETERRSLDAVLGAAGIERCTLLGISLGGPVVAAYAAAHPARVQRLILYGTFADGSRTAAEATRRALPEVVRRHWGLGSRVLASVFIPEPGSPEDLKWYAEFQRRSATPEMASRMLRFIYEIDAADAYRQVSAPTLVLHRRRDVAVPYELGLEVASFVPGARFEALEGADHPPWLGDVERVLEAIADFVRLGEYPLESMAGSGANEIESLTPREREILALVAEGLSDAQIAERLVISRHTVHRHIANIRAKLGQPSRAAAAAAAARHGLI